MNTSTPPDHSHWVISHTGETFDLTAPLVTIGSSAEQDIQIALPSVLEVHAHLRWDGDAYYLEDLSGGATYHNQQPLNGTVRLRAGDRIELGEAVYLDYGVIRASTVNMISIGDDDIIEALKVTKLSPSTDLVSVSAPLALRTMVRVGCAACFYTINPADPDEQRRTAVQVETQYYHQQCWQNAPQPDKVAVSASVPMPTPLTVLVRTPVSLYAGPLNTINDQPLGISHSTLRLENRTPHVFTLLNNSATPLEIPRYRMPAWATIDYGRYDEPGETLRLDTHQSVTATVYPGVILPPATQHDLMMSESQGIELESNQAPIVLLGFILTSILLWVLHLLKVTEVVTQLRLPSLVFPWEAALTATLALTGIVGLILFMAPGWSLWQLYHHLERTGHSSIGQAGGIKQIVGGLQKGLWLIISHQAESQIFGTWGMLLLEAILIAGGTAIIGTTVVVALFWGLSVVAPLLGLLYAALLFWILHRVWLGYGFNIFHFVYRLFAPVRRWLQSRPAR